MSNELVSGAIGMIAGLIVAIFSYGRNYGSLQSDVQWLKTAVKRIEDNLLER